MPFRPPTGLSPPFATPGYQQQQHAKQTARYGRDRSWSRSPSPGRPRRPLGLCTRVLVGLLFLAASLAGGLGVVQLLGARNAIGGCMAGGTQQVSAGEFVERVCSGFA